MPKTARKTRTKRVNGNGHDKFGFRTGSLKSKAAAMYASEKGATLNEVKAKLKSTQFNLITELEAKKFKIKRTLEAGAGSREVTRYHIMI